MKRQAVTIKNWDENIIPVVTWQKKLANFLLKQSWEFCWKAGKLLNNFIVVMHPAW